MVLYAPANVHSLLLAAGRHDCLSSKLPPPLAHRLGAASWIILGLTLDRLLLLSSSKHFSFTFFPSDISSAPVEADSSHKQLLKMVSLWGSSGNKKDSGQTGPLLHDDESGDVTRRHSETDERSRLLPPPAHGNNGYLSPDDPAVRLEHPQLLTLLLMTSGFAIQPLERPVLEILYRLVLDHDLPLVGVALHLDLRQPTRNALSRIRILRFFIHNVNPREPCC